MPVGQCGEGNGQRIWGWLDPCVRELLEVFDDLPVHPANKIGSHEYKREAVGWYYDYDQYLNRFHDKLKEGNDQAIRSYMHNVLQRAGISSEERHISFQPCPEMDTQEVIFVYRKACID